MYLALVIVAMGDIVSLQAEKVLVTLKNIRLLWKAELQLWDKLCACGEATG